MSDRFTKDMVQQMKAHLSPHLIQGGSRNACRFCPGSLTLAQAAPVFSPLLSHAIASSARAGRGIIPSPFTPAG